MRTEKLNSVLLSTLLVTSLMVPLLTMVLVSVPQASSQPPGWADHVVISEVFYDESGTDYNEFVELYNPTSSSVDISGWQLKFLNQAGILKWTLTFAPGTTIDSHGYYLIGQKSPLDSADWGGTPITPDAILPGALQQGPGDYVVLENSYVDGVKWGYEDAGTPIIEDDPNYDDVSSGNSIERKSGPTHDETQGNGYDTDDASNDFRTRTIPNPQNTMSPIEPEENIKYLDNIYWLDDPIWSHLHELYPTYSRSYLLTSWVDTNEDYTLSPSDKIDITDGNGEVTWWHVDNVTITMLVEKLDDPAQIMYIELDPELFPFWDPTAPISTWWHEIWPVFSRWYHLSSWFEYDIPDGFLGPSDIIDITDEFKEITDWHVLDLKYDIIVSRIPPPKYLDNLYDLADPISSQLHELYPEFSRQYDLTSWVDTNGDAVLSQNDIIDLTDEYDVVTWWQVDTVTITMLVENLYDIEQIMYIELDPYFFPFWDEIKYSPISTWWHEIWPVFSRWYHLSSWDDTNPDEFLGPSDIIDIYDEFGEITDWHVLDVKYDIIVQEIPPPPEEYIKENMPDLGQHCINWCWTAAAANSFKWYAHHGYPELLDAPENPGPDNWYVENMYPCPWGDNFPRLLHEIAVDALYPGMPEENIGPENTFCRFVTDNQFYHGLREFIREQGVDNLYVHEIVDNDYFGGENIPDEDGENVIYAAPTFENYKRELKRSQDVLLQLAFKNTGYEPPYENEQLDHIVTGVSFFDGGPGNRWIEVADPWTPWPPGPGPDHNNQENRYTYENWPVVDNDPLTVDITVWTPGDPFFVVPNIQVVKMIYISPAVVAENYTMDLVAGWQIIGFPLTSENMTPANLFSGMTYTMKYYVAPYGPFKEQKPNDPVELGVGYLLKLDNDKTITVTGVPVENYTMDLVAGWQIVSFPVTSASTTPANLFAGMTYTMKYYVAPYGPFKEQKPNDPVELGVGYLLKLDNNKTITIPL